MFILLLHNFSKIFHLSNYCEMASLLVAVICYRRLRHSFMQWLLPYLIFIVAGELLASFLNNILHVSTVQLYSLIIVTSHLFYSFLFYEFVADARYKKLFLYQAPWFCVLAGITLFSGVAHGLVYVIILSSILLSLIACLYFYYMLNSDDYFSYRGNISGLWIAAGLLMFYVGSTICLSLINYIEARNLTIAGEKLYNIVPRYLSVFLYGCISVAVLKWKKIKKA